MKKSLLILIGLFFSLISFGQTTSELVFKFPLDGNAIDVSGNNRTGTIVGGVTATTDRFGNANSAYSFDGTSGYIDIPYSTGIGSSDFSISFWAYQDANTTGIIFSKDRSGDNLAQLKIGYQSNGYFVESGYGSIAYVPTIGSWNYFTSVRSGLVTYLYVNGSLINSVTSASLYTSSNTYNYRIGARYLAGTSTSGVDFFKGKIDDVTMYNRALSATEIATAFTNASPNKGLLAWYKLDNSVLDSSGNGVNLTAYNATATSDRFGNANSAMKLGGFANPGRLEVVNSKLDISTSFSFSCWLNLTSMYGMSQTNSTIGTTSGCQTIFSKAGDGAGGGALLLNGSGFFFAQAGATRAATPLVNNTSYINNLVGKWSHVAYVLTQTTENIYVDGILVYSTTGSFTPTNMNGKGFALGRAYNSIWYPFNGSLDDVKFYNRELSATEVSKLYSNNDLIAAYTANSGTIKDESPIAWNTTIGTGVTLTTDRFGTKTAMAFDGTANGNITIPNSSAAFNTLPLGISFWFNTSNITSIQGLINKYVGSAYNGFSVVLSNNFITLWYYKDANNGIVSGACQKAIVANTWYHVVVNYDNTGAKLFLNGELVASAAWTGTPAISTTTEDLKFGTCPVGYNYTGKLDDIRIYNRTLTTDEINTHYTEGGGNLKSGLIAYFPFNGNTKDSVSGTACTTNGTVTPAPNRFGKANAAYYFNGASNLSFASFGLKIPANALTISLWAKTPIANVGSSVFCMSNDGDVPSTNRLNAHIRWTYNTNPVLNTYYWDFGDITTSTTANIGRLGLSNAPLVDNTWEHFVFVAGSTGMQIYRNGVLIQSGTNHSTFTAADLALLIGGKGGSGNPFYTGTLDDIKIYNRPLNATEVNSLFTEDGGNKFAGSIAYFPYDGNAKDTIGGTTSTVSSGTINAVANRFGKANSAYQFTKNWYVTQLTQTNITEYSVSAWVKMNDGEYGEIINNRTDGSDLNCRALSLSVENDNTVFFGINGSDRNFGTFAVKKVNDGSWHHIVGVFKGSRGVAVTQANFSVYIDGVLMPFVKHTLDDYNMASQMPPFNGNGYTKIGNIPNILSSASNACIIDQVRIFDRAISLQEITDYYKEGGFVAENALNIVNSTATACSATTGQYASVPSGAWFKGNFTISTWVNLRTKYSLSRLFDFGNGAGGDNVLFDPGRNLLSIYNGANGSTTFANQTIPLNQWTHIAITLSNDTAKIYYNGIKVGQTTGNYIPKGVITNNNYIGKDNWTTEYFFDGLVDEFQIYNIALSQDSIIARSHRPLTGNEAGLQLYYNFNQITGSTVPNLAKATSNADATIYNGSPFVSSLAMKTPFARAESNFTCTSFVANWDKVPSATSYQLQYGTDKTFVTTTTLNVTSNYASITGLTANTKYYYRINSSAGTIVSNWAVDSISFQMDKSLDLASNASPKLCSATTGQYASVPAGVWFNGDFTVDSWVYLRSNLTWQRLFDFATSINTGADNILFSVGDGNATPYFCIYNGATQSGFYINRKVDLNKWTHIAVTMKGDTGSVYFNGELVGKGKLLKPLNVTRTNNNIGKSNWNQDYYSNMMIDEFRMYNYALSQDSIKARSHRQLVGNEPGLQLYYNFNELIGTSTVPNLATTTVNGNATLYNSPSSTTSLASITPTTRANANSTCTGFTATWDKIPSATSYQLQYGTDKTFTTTIGSTSNITTNSLAITGLTANTKYYYRVLAVTCTGTSNWANDSISFQQNKALDLTNAASTLSSVTTGKYASVPSGVWFNGDFTFDTWVKVQSSNYNDRIFDFGDATTSHSDNIVLKASPTSNGTELNIYKSGVVTNLYAPVSLYNGKWNHIAITLKGSTATIYINGVMVAQSTAMNIPNNVTRPSCLIGKANWTTDPYGSILIDEFRIYNYALSQDSLIARSHRQLIGNETGLQLYYNFNEVYNTTIPNLATATNNAGNATIYNSPSTATALSTYTPFIRAKTNISTTGFTANWDNIANTSSYTLQYSNDKTFATILGTVSPTISTAPISGLAPNSKYYYRVNATLCSKTSEWSPIDSLSTPYLSASTTHNAMNFDGVNDYIKTPSLVTTAIDNISMEAWVKWNGSSTTTTSQTIISNGDNGFNGYSIQTYDTQGHLAILCGGVYHMKTSYILPTNVWQHVAAVRSSGIWSFYVNGISISLPSNTATPSTPAGSTIIGGSQVNTTVGTENFNGTIDEVRIWNIARTQTDIQNNMYRAISSPKTVAGLIAYYNFNQGTANGTNTGVTAVIDSSASAKNATITNIGLSGTSSNFVNGAPFTTIGKAINNSTTAIVASNTTWTASSNQTWLSVSPTTGTGNGTLTLITTAANPSITTRSATVTLSVSGTPAQTIVVTQVPCDTILTLSATTANIGKAASSTATASVASNATWTASSDQSWLTVSPNTATTGAATLTFATTSANPTITPRSATVTVKVSPTTLKTITITQAVGDTLFTISSTTASLAKTINASALATITSNASWTASSDQSWLSLSPITTTGTGTLTFTAVTANPLTITRTAIVTIKVSATTIKTITVTQDAGNPTLSVSPSTASLAKTANSSAIATIASNTSWTASSNQTWLSLSASSGTGNSTITLTATTTNPSITPRTASVTISATGATTQTITVTQAIGDTTFIVGSNTASIAKAANSSASTAITTNATWTASSNQSWLSVSPSVATTGSANLTFTATTANPSIITRTANVIVKVSATTQQTITITQAIGDTTLSIVSNSLSIAKDLNSTITDSVYSNATWKATTDQPSWLSVSPTDGTENGLLTLTTKEANPYIISRSAIVTVKVSSTTLKTFSVIQNPGDTTLIVTPAIATIAKSAGSKGDIAVTSNATWTANSNVSWLSVSSSSATTGNGTVSYTAQENPTIATRTAIVTIKVSSKTLKTVTITQAVGDATLAVSTNTVDIAKLVNSTATANVISNTDWTTTSIESWLSVDLSTGNGNKTLVFTAKEENPTTTPRTATVRVQVSANNYQDIVIKQSGSDATISVSTNTVQIGKDLNKTANADVKSNINWIATSNVSWLSVSPSIETANNATLEFKVIEANPTITSRTAIVTVKSDSAAIGQTISVVQDPGDTTFTVSPNNVSIAKDIKSEATATVTSNATWTVSSNQSWLTVKPSSATNGNGTITFTINEANPTIIERTATITIAVSPTTVKTITVTQASGDTTLSASSLVASVTKSANSSTSVTVTSNATWTASSDQPTWLEVTKDNATLNIKTLLANTTVKVRTANVTVKVSNTKQITIKVFQAIGDTILSVNSNTVSLNKTDKDEAKVSITSNTSWTASTDQPLWLNVSPSTATIGNGEITISAKSANPTTEIRSANVIIRVSATLSKVINVFQSEGDSTLSVGSSDIAIAKDAKSTASTAVSSNTIWTASSDQAWLTVNPSSATLGDGTLTITTIEANPTIAKRTATVLVKASNTLLKKITITQSIGDTVFTVSSNTASVTKESASSASITLTSNAQWTASSDQTWLTITPSLSGNGNATFTFTTTEKNPTIVTRTANVSLQVSPTKKQIIAVTQAAGDATLAVSSNKETLAKTANSSAKVTVTSNTSWSASSDKEWLSVNPNSLTTGDATLTLTATSNPTIASRTATISISATGVSPQSIVVTQDAGDPTLSVGTTTFSVSKEANASTWVSISSNTAWTAKSDQDWLKLSQESGFANGTLVFLVSGNTTPSSRTAKVTISADGVTSQTVTIIQASCTITSSSISKTACDSIVYNNITYKVSGDYVQKLQNKAGCDSIINLSLIINHPTASTIAASACNSYTYYGKTYTSSGAYTQKLVNKLGCDSIVTLNLTINTPTTSTVTEASCSSYTLNDSTYTKSGTYTQTIKNKAGCDSVITLQLTIKNPTFKSITATACGTYTINGQNYTSTGKYYQTLVNKAGCDSTITLNVTINPVYNTSFKASACESYTYNQKTYTTSGLYTHTLQSKTNCDSIVTLDLTILGKPSISFTPSAPSTCKGVNTSIVANGAKTYVWSTGSTNATTSVSPTQTTSYIVTAVDANSCVNTASVTVTVNSLPTLTWNANNPTLVCNDGSSTSLTVDVIPTGGLGVFSGVTGLVKTNETSTSFDPKQNNSGVKTINYDYIDINGCKASITGEIEVYTTPIPAIISKSVVSTTITGITLEVPKDAYSNVKWYSQSATPTLLATGDTLKLAVGSASNAIPLNLAGDQLEVGSYKYNYSQTTKGCESKTSQAIIIVNNCPAQAPKADAVPKICFTGSTTVNLSATATDLNGNLTWFDGSDIATAKTLASDVNKYTVTVTNVGSQVYYAAEYDTVHACYSAPVAINVIAYSVPTVAISAKENAVCKGSSTELLASGAATYAWTGSSVTSSSIVSPTTDTDYFVTGTDINGCSNIASKNIKVKLPTTATITATACSNYTVNNVTYTKSDIYTQTLANNAGCDSTITLNITITSPTTSTITTSTCKSYTLNGKVYDQSGTYTQTVQNVAKCDSIITLNLTITKPSVVSYSQTAIGYYMFNNKKLSLSGTYTDTLVSKSNCDSIVTCNLTILQNKIPVNQIVAPNTLGIVTGETLLLGYTTLPNNATSKNIVFSSLDTTIVTIDKTGLIKAKAKGVTYVTIAETESLVSTLCLITVTDAVIPLETFTLPASLTMVIGETQTIPVKFTPIDASNQTLSWSSPNTSKVTVDNFGVVHALATGKILLVATSISETDYISKSIVVNVLPSFKPVIKPLPAINIITGQTSKSFDISSYVSDDNTATKSLIYSFSGNNTTITPINDTVFSFAPKTIGAVYSDTITVSVTDKDKQTSSSKLVFNVMLAPNKAPKLSIIDTITIKSEKGHYEQNLVSLASDDYTLQSNLVWSLKNVAQHATVAITNNILMISSPVDGWSGKDSIIVKVTDGDGLSTDERIVIMVSSKPNQKPEVTPIPNQFNATSSPFKAIDLNQYVTDDYTQKSNIVWLTSESSKLAFAIENGIATVSIKDPNWVGTTTITFTAMDEDFAMSSVNVFFAQTVPNSSTWMTKPNISFSMPNTTIGVGIPYELSATILGAESWKWKTEGGNPATSNDLNPIITYNKPGTYSVTLVAQNSKGIDSVVKTNLITVFGIVNNDTTVCKGSKVPVSVNLKDLTTYSWNTGDKTSSILTTITSDTVLIVTAQKDLKIFTDTITIKVNKAVSLGKDTAICEGSSVTLNPGTYKLYKWQDGSTAPTLALDNKTAKTYSVTVTDFNECVSSDNVVVTEVKSVPVAGLLKTAIFCQGLSTTLTANTGYSYIWKDKFNTQTSTNNSLVVQNEGTYYVTITASNGCKAIDSTVVTVNQLPTVSLQASKASICLGDSVTFTTTGAKDYIWSNGISDGPQFKITTLGNNSYSVTGTDINGCINTAITSVTVNEVPELAINAKQYTICNGQKITLDASGAPNLTWDNGVINGQEFTPSVSGTYTATGTNSVGCIDTIHVSIIVNALPTVTAKADKNIVCANTNITLTGDGASSYSWDNNVIDNTAFAIAESKTFAVTGTDTKGCSSSANVAVTVRNTFAEQIKVATYNEEGTGIIVAWTPTKGKGTSGYELQRLNDTTGTFKTVAIRGAQDSTYYVDKNADATLKAYSYKLITSDSVCAAKAESAIHQTIHLTPSQSTNESTEVVLEWNTYKGMTVTKYQIYVIDKGKIIDTLYASDVLNAESLSQTYKEHKKGYKYRIAFDLPDSVFTGKLKSDSGPYSQSLSNMAESELVSSTIVDGDFEVTLYPVPANDELHIKAESAISNYEIYDMLGQLIQRGKYSSEAININNLANGLYQIILHSNELTTKARFIKE